MTCYYSSFMRADLIAYQEPRAGPPLGISLYRVGGKETKNSSSFVEPFVSTINTFSR